MKKLTLKQKWSYGIVFALFSITALMLIFHHEPWQDELKAWIIARDLNCFQIIYWMRYDGHFALWHFLLRPIAVFGPIFGMNVLSWGLCIAAAGIFIRYARLPLWLKILFLLSCPCIFYYPVVARPYAMLPLILCLLAALYPVRLKKRFSYALAILLLLYVHSYLAGYAGCLGLLFLLELIKHTRNFSAKEKMKALLPPLLMLAGALCAFLMVIPAVGASSVVPQTFKEFIGNDLLKKIWDAFRILPERHALPLQNPIGAALYWLGIAAGVTVVRFTRRKMLFFLIGGALWTILMAALVYPMLMHRGYLPMIMLLFVLCLPVDKKERKVKGHLWKYTGFASIALLALLTFPDAYSLAVNDWKHPFSNQGQMAYFIETHVPEDAKIVTFPPDLISGCFPAYLPNHRFYSCRTNTRFIVFKCKEGHPAFLNDALLHYYAEGSKPYYLLMNVRVIPYYRITDQKLKYGFRDFRVEPLFMTNPPAFFPAKEDYLLLKVTPKNQ